MKRRELDGARVVALIRGDEDTRIERSGEGEVVLDQTPFYAESGGQVEMSGPYQALPQVGLLPRSADSSEAVVLDTSYRPKA